MFVIESINLHKTDEHRLTTARSKLSDGLTSKQIKFINEYLIDHNATAAARRAGYSAHTANVQGTQLLSNTKVAAEISQRQKSDSARLEVTKEKLIAELAQIAFSDPNAIISCLQAGKSLKDANLKFLKSISVSKNGWNIVMADKLSAIGLLMKYLGFEPKSDSVNLQSDENSETGLQRILRIVKERAERQREKDKINGAGVHPSSPLRPEKE